MRDKTPMQPIEFAADGVIRFRQNRIVDDLLDFAHAQSGVVGITSPYKKFTMTDIAIGVHEKRYTREEYEQFRQLIGYSVSRYGECDLVSKASIAEADAIGGKVWRDAERAEKAAKGVKANSVKRRKK